jgi:hypothetical protein
MRWPKSAIAVAVLALAIPGNSCGPFFMEMVFVNRSAPPDLEPFLNGRIGIVQQGLRPRYLALAYRILSGPPLTDQEKSSLLDAHKALQDQNASSDLQSLNRAALEWSEERLKINPAAGDVPLHASRAVPGQQWQDFDNCLQDAFSNAARTLAARVREHAAEKAELAEWISGQDAVFSNCDGSGQIPAPVSRPQWLANDRAYQIAAAHFYRSEFAPAEEQFALIAADSGSPLRSLAAFMVGRCLLRQATLSLPDKNDDNLMRQAAAQFQKVMQAGGTYAGPAEELLNFVDLRINPGVAAARLGDRISHPDPRLQQHLTDLAYVGDDKWLEHQEDARKSDLVDWALTMQGFPIDPKRTPRQNQAFQHAKERWRQTGNAAWLIAALNNAHAPDEELIRAAESVPPTSPAWVTITYGRLQLRPAGVEARAQDEKLLRDLAALHESQDTLNLFTILARQKAESLEQYARLAPLEPVGEDDGVDGFGPLSPASAPPTGMALPTMAGLPINVSGVKRIDSETAIVLNQHLPLKDLVPMVLNSTWPRQLRFELAMAVWTRAVLLDRPQDARRLSPVMIAGEPGWKQWLTAYDAAATNDEHRITGLLALMRFPSVRPYINASSGREEGFAAYSGYRDNWWCADMGGFNYDTGHNFGAAYPNPNQPPSIDLPSFVTPSMTSESNQEHAELAKIGDAPEYFGNQTLAWVKAHPKDPRNSELLGFALRAMRNGCNLEKSFALKREIFKLLHSRYPQSEWAKKYPVLDDENP